MSAADAKAVLEFVCTKVLATARPPGEPGGISRDVTVRQALEAAEKSIPAAFSNQPTVEASVRAALGDTEIYLGNWSNAVPQLERAVELFRANLGPES